MDRLSEALRVNPLARHFPDMRAKIREKLAEAKADSRLRARYLLFTLNLPSADEQTMLLSVEDWQVALVRIESKLKVLQLGLSKLEAARKQT
ncbi:MAG: hypothetical protein OXC93_07250 [Rhodospirillaceae bacterium]|nr:hypothetical protein [Rhodospirillaceae bacterium]